MLQVCPNGVRAGGEHPRLPVRPSELADEVRAAVAEGATDVHLHPKDAADADTVAGAAVAEALTAVRAAVPGVPVGVTTGAWTCPDPAERAAVVAGWTVLPDHASVNWHEDGADLVAAELIRRGVGIEAGIFPVLTQRSVSWSGDRGPEVPGCFGYSLRSPMSTRILHRALPPRCSPSWPSQLGHRSCCTGRTGEPGRC